MPQEEGTHVCAPLQAGEVHVRDEEYGLCVEVQERLEHCAVCPLVRGQQWSLHVCDCQQPREQTE